MIELPDLKKAFEYENNFYLSCDITRISKLLAQYKLFAMTRELPGSIVECGVFKGCSFIRFAVFRELFDNPFSKKLVGFDTFGKFPETEFGEDKSLRQQFINEAGEESISRQQLMEMLAFKRTDRNIELIEGNIMETVPAYVTTHPEMKISLLNLDTDIYEPAVTVLEYLFPKMVRGGILILDDYGTFPGETKAVDDYFRGQRVTIRKFPFCMTPSYIVKEE
jgi:hypothetical protein